MLLQTLIGLICAFVVTSALTPSKGTVERRAPAMGFMGMRGKKDAIPDDKRSPSMGFMGMRGKKDDYLDGLSELSDDKRAMGFVGMRGKKDTDFDYDIDYPEKRANMGFMGVRGKKEDYYKRAMGFVGMRGKKDDYLDEFAEDDYWPTEEFDKRAPSSSGFFGMRGKKVPSSGFFGMRGKKIPFSGYYGSRGKKGPLAGFMGVRGKKDSNGDLEAFLSSLVDRQGGGSSKRAPTPYNYRNFADSVYSVVEEKPDAADGQQPEFCQ